MLDILRVLIAICEKYWLCGFCVSSIIWNFLGGDKPALTKANTKKLFIGLISRFSVPTASSTLYVNRNLHFYV